MSTLNRQSLYQAMVEAGCELDHHESDLYVKDTPAAVQILRDWRTSKGSQLYMSRFISRVDATLWIEIPFAYDPWWEAAVRASRRLGSTQAQRAESSTRRAAPRVLEGRADHRRGDTGSP